jgi:hypothetical protein
MTDVKSCSPRPSSGTEEVAMSTPIRTLITLAAAAALAACGSSMMDHEGAMRGHIEATEAEHQAHLDAGRTATTMPEMMAEMDRHQGQMGDMMGMMDGAMDDMMSHCRGSGMTAMMDHHDQMMGEMEHHAQAMGEATDLAAAHAELERHGEAMGAMFDQMHADTATMHCGGMH